MTHYFKCEVCRLCNPGAPGTDTPVPCATMVAGVFYPISRCFCEDSDNVHWEEIDFAEFTEIIEQWRFEL